MQMEISQGGDGASCWNRQAVEAHVREQTEKEARLSRDNPDLVVLGGRVKCYGCALQEYHYGVKCTAQLTRTRFALPGEIEPRAADAAASQQDIAGLLAIKPGSQDQEAVAAAAPAGSLGADPSASAAPPPAVPARHGGLRGLFNR